MKFALFISIIAINTVAAMSFNSKEYVYVTDAYFISLYPIISTNFDLAFKQSGKESITPYTLFKSTIQRDVIRALRKRGFLAVPDFTCSDFQSIQNFEYLSEISDFLKTERPVFNNKFTILPILKNSLMKITEIKKRYSYDFLITLGIFHLTRNGELKELGDIALKDNITIDSIDVVDLSKKVLEVNENLSNQLTESDEWMKIIRSKDISFLKERNQLNFDSLLCSKGEGNSYFLSSSAIYKEKYPLGRMLKTNFYTRQTRVSDLENEKIGFDISEEIPAVFNGYILLPNNDILYLNNNNLQINSVSNSGNGFSSKRSLTINLAGL